MPPFALVAVVLVTSEATSNATDEVRERMDISAAARAARFSSLRIAFARCSRSRVDIESEELIFDFAIGIACSDADPDVLFFYYKNLNFNWQGKGNSTVWM